VKIFVFLFLFAFNWSSPVFGQIPSADQFWFHGNPRGNSHDTGILRTSFPPAEGRDISVALISSGVDATHPFLKDTLSSRSSGSEDKLGQGTHLAGIMASFAKFSPNFIFKKIKVSSFKVSSGAGLDPARQMTVAIDQSISAGAKVIFISVILAPAQKTIELERSLDRALQAGIVVIAAAGDQSRYATSYPCTFKNVICVGATDQSGKVSASSNFGAPVDLFAPGVEIMSSVPGGKFEKRSGTAQAGAIITSFVAALLAFDPYLTQNELHHRLAFSSKNGFPELIKIFFPPGRDVPLISFKGMPFTTVKEMDFGFSFDVLNLGKLPNRVVLEYSVNGQDFVLGKKTEVISFSSGVSTQRIVVPVKIANSNALPRFRLNVKISHFGDSTMTSLETTLVSEKPGMVLAELELTSWKKSGVISGVNDHYLYSVNDQNIFTFYNIESNGLRRLGQRQLEPQEVISESFLRILDADGDGRDDLFFGSSIGTTQRLEILSLDLKKKFSGILGTSENFGSQIFFIKHSFEGKKIHVPLFLKTGSVTLSDVEPGDFLEVDPDRHIYWLEPVRRGSEVVFNKRTFTHARFREKIFSTLSVSTSSLVDIIHVSQIDTGLLVMAGVKDSDGVTSSGLALELNSTSGEPKIYSIGFDRPLDKNGFILPIHSVSGRWGGDVLFISAPSVQKISLSHLVAKGMGKGLGQIGEISIPITDKFLNVPLVLKTPAGIRTWVQTESSLLILNEDKKVGSFGLETFQQDDSSWLTTGIIKTSKGMALNHAPVSGDWLSFISFQGGQPVSTLTDSFYARGCHLIGQSSTFEGTDFYFSCPEHNKMKVLKYRRP
jgi:hypothetical protein